MKKISLFMMAVVLSANLLSGCGNKKADDKEKSIHTEVPAVTEHVSPTEENSTQEPNEGAQTEEVTTNPNEEETDFTFAEVMDQMFVYESGVGTWGTQLSIHGNGTFTGSYHDWKADEEYPDGIFYLCGFRGEFTQPKKIDEFTYSMRIERIELDEEVGTEEIVEGQKNVYCKPYGLDGAEEILFFKKGIDINKLPQGYQESVPYFHDKDEKVMKLPFYGLYNVKEGCGFASADICVPPAIDEELENVAKEAQKLKNRLEKEDLSQTEMNMVASELYQLWDRELNSIWNTLKETLDTSTMNVLIKEEREWIQKKEEEVKKAGAVYEGGSIRPLIEDTEGAELTRKRVYELAEYLR